MQLIVNTPDKNIFTGEAYEVLLPTSEGEVGILPQHRPYVAKLQAGELSFKLKKEQDTWQHFAISYGMAEFYNETLTVLVRTAENADEIDLDLAKHAREEALKLKTDQTKLNMEEIASLTAQIEREVARVKIAEKYRKRRV
jgi:F-type H+-transporting ATPase subunit epsilon